MLTVCHDLRITEIYYDPLYWRLCKGWREYVFLFDSLLFKGYIQRKNMMNIAKRYIGRPNIKFVAVSQHTRHHVIVHFPQYLHQDIPVFYSAMLELVNENGKECSFSELPNKIKPQKYFFMDSGWRWSKNDLRAAMALDNMFTKHPELDMNVVITGIKESKPFFRYLKNKDRFVLLGYVGRDGLNTLHRDAFATIYPTLGEGFGYTPMESFKFGVPVIAACNSSVVEVCGDAALYVNPYSLQEIENRCLQLLDSSIYKEFQSKALPRYDYISSIQKKHLEEFVEYIQQMTLK